MLTKEELDRVRSLGRLALAGAPTPWVDVVWLIGLISRLNDLVAERRTNR